MAGIHSSTNCSVTSLKQCLPDLQILNQPEQMPEVRFNQEVNIRDSSLQESEVKSLRDVGPTMYIQGLAEIWHECLRLRLALKTEGRVADGTQAKIYWKAQLVADKACEKLGKRTKFFSVPPEDIIRTSDDYIVFKLRDIRPNFIQNGSVIKIEWKVRLEFLCEIGTVDTVERKLVLCCHHISDSLDTIKNNHQPRDQAESGTAEVDMRSVVLRT